MTVPRKYWEEMTLAELEAERAHWAAELDAATSWGAAVAAAHSFYQGCETWIARRKREQSNGEVPA